jgi:hypothetical protein
MLMIKVYGIICRLTGTSDYQYSNCEECKTCSYSKMCQAKFNEEELTLAKEQWLDGQRMINEGEMLVDMARKTFEDQAIKNDVLKYQVTSLMISRVYIAPYTTYPKAKLLKQFTIEQLEPCAEKKEAVWQLRVNDLLKEKKKND